MADIFCGIGASRILEMTLHVPYSGAWWAEARFEGPAPEAVPGAPVSLVLDDLTLKGTADPIDNGVFAGQRKARIVAGGGGWGRQLPPKGYANDAGVLASGVAEDAARLAGETLGEFSPQAESVGRWYSRRAGPAAETLESVIGEGRLWWVGYDGLTHVAPSRPARPQPRAGKYQILDYDARERLAPLAVDRPSIVLPGDLLIADTDLTEEPLLVRDMSIVLNAESLRVLAWCGPAPSAEARGRLSGAIQRIVNRASGGRLWGCYRYRAISMHSDGRVNIQAVSAVAGVPDLLRVEQWPGIPGGHGELTPGAEVLVEFVAGDRGDPVVRSFAGRSGPGHVPAQLVLCSEDNSAPLAARQGDTVRTLLPPAVFTGSIGGAPATGVLTFPTGYTLGSIETSSGKVRIG